MIQKITTNISGTIRHAQLEGRDHLVVPMVMLVEGVHAGSDGPLFYPGDEIAKAAPIWNHKPIVVYHPKENGVGVTACSPAVLNQRKVGIILNTRYEDKKLKAEAWVEVSRLEAVDPRILEGLESETIQELSTGLFTANELADGEHNGKHYTAIARNHGPDHLAILPDEVGACSVADGAGFLRLNEAIRSTGWRATNKIMKAIDDVLVRMGLVNNYLNPSDNNTRHALQMLVQGAYVAGGTDAPGPWVEDVYSKEQLVIFEYESKIWKQAFTMSDGKLELTGDRVEVMRITEYRTADGAFVGNRATIQEKQMTRDEMVAKLVGNGRFDDTDKPALMAMPEATLAKMLGDETPVEPGVEANQTAAEVGGGATVTTAAPKEVTEEELVANMAKAFGTTPGVLREAVSTVVANGTHERATLVAQIVGNGGGLTEADLTGLGVPALRKMARVGRPVNYEGAAGGQFTVVGNAGGDEEPLDAPETGWGHRKTN